MLKVTQEKCEGDAREQAAPAAEAAGQSPEEYYGDHYADLVGAKRQVCDLVEEFKAAHSDEDDLKPVVYYTARIKSPASLVEKLARLGVEGGTYEDAVALGIHDVVGVRVNCAFMDDVYEAARWLEARPEVEVVDRKDYIEHPKPNGYRSLHLIIRVSEGPASRAGAMEVQLRTIGIDFWATLEHKIKYKKSVRNPELMQAELKRCADEIASIDISMQAIRNVIRDAD